MSANEKGYKRFFDFFRKQQKLSAPEEEVSQKP